MLEVLIGVAIVGGIIYLNKKGNAQKDSVHSYSNGFSRVNSNNGSDSNPARSSQAGSGYGADPFRGNERPADHPIPQPHLKRRPFGTSSAGANAPGIRNKTARPRPRRIINLAGTNLADYGWRFVPASTMSSYTSAADFINSTNHHATAKNINSKLDGLAGGMLVSAALVQGQNANYTAATTPAGAHGPANSASSAGFAPASSPVNNAASANTASSGPQAGNPATGANPLGTPSPGRHIGINRSGQSAGANTAGSNGPYPNGQPAPQYQNTGNYSSGESHTGRYILGGLAAGALLYGIFGHHDYGSYGGYPYGYGGYGGFGGHGMMDPNMNPMHTGGYGRPDGVAEAAALDGDEESFNPTSADNDGAVSNAATGTAGAGAADYLYGAADTYDYDDTDSYYSDDNSYNNADYQDNDNADTGSYYGDDNNYNNTDYDSEDNIDDNAYYGDDNSYNNADYDDNDRSDSASYYGDDEDSYSDEDEYAEDDASEYSDNDSDYSDNDDNSDGGWFGSNDDSTSDSSWFGDDDSSDDSSWFSGSGSDDGGFFGGGNDGSSFFDGGDDW